jgi:hypothetical protein
MTKRAKFLASVHGVDYNTGQVWATDPSTGISIPAYRVPQFDTEYGKLLLAAPLLYRAIDVALPMIETIGMIFEAHDMEDHVAPLHNLESGLNVAISAATLGYIKQK